ncbi:DNA topoisomerase (ATP-hydrolyzing) subunit B [bacterium]|nr:DNA topoisomerase (ATP-hydrolyzing) subunit B [bacterium]
MADEKKTLDEQTKAQTDKDEILTGVDENLGHVTKEYGGEDIQILKGLQPVKLRPGMYIGTTGPQGLHHLVWEIVDNSVDEALAGRCDRIEVELLNDDSISVKDNGRGIPVDIKPETGRPAIESVFTTLHAGGKFKGGAYTVSGGLHGVGASVVNALSKWLHVYVKRNGNIYYQEYTYGDEGITDLKIVGNTNVDDTGSTIIFSPDPEIFKEGTKFNYETIRSRLQTLAFLNKGVTFTIEDKRTGEEKELIEYCYLGGVKEYVEFLNNGQMKLNQKPMYFEGKQESDNIQVEISMQYNTTFNTMLYCYTNNIHNPEGGTHEEAFKSTLTRLLNKYGVDHNLFKKDESLTGDDTREGLIAVVSVKHPNPQFEGQTKTKLGSEDARKAVSNIMGPQLQRFLDENPQDAKTIIDKALTALHARIAAKKARENVQRKGPLDSLGLASKLSDCRSKDPAKSEIFSVEGDSAGGSAKQGRDSEFQAILPLRGKVLNVEKARMDKILANKEIVSMIQAFGAGMDNDFDVTKLRYHKVVIMTDADVDGAHIRTLLLTFFYRHMKPLIQEGYVYIAQPPLYRIQSNKNIQYAYSDEERDEILSTLSSKPQIQRYKGLGEMDDTQLWDTTLNPDNRVLLRVNLNDAIEADLTFSTLMGEDVEPRRDFINENAGYVKDLDY